MLPPTLAALCVSRLERGGCPLPAPCHLFWRHANLGMTREGQSVVREKTGEFRAVLSSLVFTWLAHQAWQPCGLSTRGS